MISKVLKTNSSLVTEFVLSIWPLYGLGWATLDQALPWYLYLEMWCFLVMLWEQQRNQPHQLPLHDCLYWWGPWTIVCVPQTIVLRSDSPLGKRVDFVGMHLTIFRQLSLDVTNLHYISQECGEKAVHLILVFSLNWEFRSGP